MRANLLPLVIVSFFAGLGYWVGVERTENQYETARENLQRELFEVSDDLSKAKQELEFLRANQANRSKQIEDEIRNDPDTSRPGISADGLRRLERRWALPD